MLAKSLCSTHYERQRRNGAIGAGEIKRAKSPIINGKKQCGKCNTWKILIEFNTHQHGSGGVDSRCRECQTMHNTKWREANREYWKAWIQVPGNREKGIASSHNRRARIRGVEYEFIDRQIVFERDGFICGICSEPIDRLAKFPDVGSASLDHVIPLNKGGDHLYSNVQAAHFGCNSGKCDRIIA